MSDKSAAIIAFIAWCSGASFAEIHTLLGAGGVRFGNQYAKVEHVVALCENAFGYDAAMVIASLTDLAEPLDGVLYEELQALQKLAKYGVATPAAAAFYEAGFADRIVATTLAKHFDGVSDRREARLVVRLHSDEVAEIVDPFPAYFHAVVNEISG
jgi:hypothetical protein